MESNDDDFDSGQEASLSESDGDDSGSDVNESEKGNDSIIYGNFGW